MSDLKMRWVCSCALLLMVLDNCAVAVPAWTKHTVRAQYHGLVLINMN